MIEGTGEQAVAEQFNLAVKLLNESNISRAGELVSDITTSFPNYFKAHDLLGLVRYYQGDLAGAEVAFNHALSINPDYKDAKEHLAFLKNILHEMEHTRRNTDTLHATWYKKVPNWGDALNQALLEDISGKYVSWAAPYDYRFSDKYIVIGSILHLADAHSIIWGAGAMSEQRLFAVPPKRVCAVRGPLTRQLLIREGIQCPEVYGDPALLYPRFYDPKIKVTHDLGIIPHFVDQDNPWIKYARDQGIMVINILGGLHEVIEKIKSCKRIASSSLHGLIAADAYGIPSTWIEFSNKVDGGGFKFRDYFQSVNRREYKPLRIAKGTRTEDIFDTFQDYSIDIDLGKLYENCPFLPAGD